MALVFKIKVDDTIRRWTLPESCETRPLTMSFEDVELKIRQLFGLSAYVSLTLTYVDGDGDVVTLADDEDLEDACIQQRLNPLRLRVAVSDKTFEEEERKARFASHTIHSPSFFGHTLKWDSTGAAMSSQHGWPPPSFGGPGFGSMQPWAQNQLESAGDKAKPNHREFPKDIRPPYASFSTPSLGNRLCGNSTLFGGQTNEAFQKTNAQGTYDCRVEANVPQPHPTKLEGTVASWQSGKNFGDNEMSLQRPL